MASRSWNRVELIGNLTRDPELRYTPSGSAVATFSIATNRTYVVDGERKEDVDFHRIVAWAKLAEKKEIKFSSRAAFKTALGKARTDLKNKPLRLSLKI